MTDTPSQQIDAQIKELGDWRGETLARVRKAIKQAEPDVVEELKWSKPSSPGGVPVWSLDGIDEKALGDLIREAVALNSG